MGNCSDKPKKQKDETFFTREKAIEEDLRNVVVNVKDRKDGLIKDTPLIGLQALSKPPPIPVPSPAYSSHSYDDEAVERMRYQLQNDSNAFLLNNILLSVQFFENYEREIKNIKNNPLSDREQSINDTMVRHHKHVFFADRLQECVQEHVRYFRRKGYLEPLAASRLFVIYDNVEASEPGDTSDYSAVLDAPFYKLCVQNTKEPGYIKLKKIEVLESTAITNEMVQTEKQPELNNISDESAYTDSEKESNDSDEDPHTGEMLLQRLQTQLNGRFNKFAVQNKIISDPVTENTGRRRSGPIKQLTPIVSKGSIANIKKMGNLSVPMEDSSEARKEVKLESKPSKSILKGSKSMEHILANEIACAGKVIRKVNSETNVGEDTETSGYRSNSSGRNTEVSETESDYGYSTIKIATTPKRVELSLQSNLSVSSGVLPDECWAQIKEIAISNWSDDEDDGERSEVASKDSSNRNLYDINMYLNSTLFMTNFVDNFMIKLGNALGISREHVNNALTQGASVYCDTLKNGARVSYEVIPALIGAWPNAANQWIIRERKIIQNPRTNFSYQWPTKYMVNKAVGLGCLLLPIGFRPKRGSNSEQEIQWRVIFPAAERYLESCLAHSHIRCYLFTLALHKTFMEDETSKIGIDASHIKNHLFWQCEDNLAKWPEDRLGESLRLFLQSFYMHFAKVKFPNYFAENCNDFKSIPVPYLRILQRRLADILEKPVMHVLSAIDKLKYTQKDYYPPLDVHTLYRILTTKNPLRIINPNLPVGNTNVDESSDSDNEYEAHASFWDQAKSNDKHYQWKKAKQRQDAQRRKGGNLFGRKQKAQKTSSKTDATIDKNIVLPSKMDPERRRLVLEFFIPHFLAMARCSDKFGSTKQAIIYLEQAQRLCILLLDEPAGDTTANEHLEVIREELAECHRTLINKSGYGLPTRKESKQIKKHKQAQPIRKRPNIRDVNNQDSPTDGIAAFSFVADIHEPSTSGTSTNKTIKLSAENGIESDEETML